MRLPLLAMLATLGLAACAGSKEPIAKQYYVLGLNDPPLAQSAELTSPGFEIARVDLAAHLNETGLAMILTGNRINIAAHSLWGESLDRTVPRLLARDLQVACLCRVTNSVWDDETHPKATQLSLRIDRFGPTDQGRVILSGEYRLDPAAGDARTRTFFLAQDLQEDGYRAAVATMRAELTDLAARIASDQAPSPSAQSASR